MGYAYQGHEPRISMVGLVKINERVAQMRFFLFLMFFCGVARAKLPPGMVVTENDSFLFKDPGDHLLYVGREHTVSIDQIDKLRGRELFVFPLTNFLDVRDELKKRARIYHYQERDFALVEPLDNKIDDLANFAHSASLACGALLALTEESEISDFVYPVGKPLISLYSSVPQIADLQDRVQHERIESLIKSMEALGTRFHTSKSGIETPRFLARIYRSLTPANRKDVSIEMLDVNRSPQDNLRVRILGSEKPDDILILGSHIDSITTSRSGLAPGGDDDASGTAINIEIFRVLMEAGIKPTRTIEFHGYAAEEVGLVGSSSLAADYQRRKARVLAMVQFDLALYSGPDGKLDTMYFVTNGTSRQLTSDLVRLTKTYLQLETVTARLTAGTSDHRSWARKGYATAFPTENPRGFNRKIHTVGDTIENLPNSASQFAALYAKLGLAFALHFGGF